MTRTQLITELAREIGCVPFSQVAHTAAEVLDGNPRLARVHDNGGWREDRMVADLRRAVRDRCGDLGEWGTEYEDVTVTGKPQRHMDEN